MLMFINLAAGLFGVSVSVINGNFHFSSMIYGLNFGIFLILFMQSFRKS